MYKVPTQLGLVGAPFHFLQLSPRRSSPLDWKPMLNCSVSALLMTVLLSQTVFQGGNILDYVKMTESQATGIPVLPGAQPSSIPTLFMLFAHLLHSLLPSAGRWAKSAGNIRTRERAARPPTPGGAWGRRQLFCEAASSAELSCLWNTNRTGSRGEGF